MRSRHDQSDYSEGDLKVEHPEDHAAGPTAVAVSMKRALGQMGVKRTAQTLLKLNQAEGFDCMSCAWPDPDPGHRHTAEFCENGAKAVAEEATLNRATPEFFAEHSIADLDGHTEHWLGQQGRITHPMIKRPGATHYTPIDWDAAFGVIGAELKSLGSPDEAIFYTSGRASNEAAFAYQLFARAFGTNNMPDCSNMCHESTSIALQESIGIGKASVSIDDVLPGQADRAGRAEPGNQPSANALGPRDRQGKRCEDHFDQSAPRGGVGPVQESPVPERCRRPGDRAVRSPPAYQAQWRSGPLPGHRLAPGAVGCPRSRLHSRTHQRIRAVESPCQRS